MDKQIKIRLADQKEIENWDDLIKKFPNYRVTHLSAWLHSLENTVGGKMLHIIYEKEGEIVGCLPGMIIRVGFLNLFGSTLPGWQTVSMGPVFDPAKLTTEELIKPLIRFLENKFAVHHIEIMGPPLDAGTMEELGFSGRNEYTFKAPLYPEDENKNLMAMKTNARRNIKRAGKLGLRVNFHEDDEFIEEVYDQIKEVFLRGGNVVPFNKKRVREFYQNMREGGNLLAVSVELPEEDVCIATGLFTVENKELLLWMWTHRTDHRWYRPTEFMTWAVMQRAMQRGCETLDLMGRGDFKAKFGAKICDKKIRWIRSRHRWLTTARNLSEKIYRAQQSLRGKISQRKSFSGSAKA